MAVPIGLGFVDHIQSGFVEPPHDVAAIREVVVAGAIEGLPVDEGFTEVLGIGGEPRIVVLRHLHREVQMRPRPGSRREPFEYERPVLGTDVLHGIDAGHAVERTQEREILEGSADGADIRMLPGRQIEHPLGLVHPRHGQARIEQQRPDATRTACGIQNVSPVGKQVDQVLDEPPVRVRKASPLVVVPVSELRVIPPARGLTPGVEELAPVCRISLLDRCSCHVCHQPYASRTRPSPPFRAFSKRDGRTKFPGGMRRWPGDAFGGRYLPVVIFLQANTDIEDILNLDLLIKQLALALGLAMVLGNAYAIYKNRKGEKPKDEEGDFRPARAYWLLGVGVVISIWGAVSLLA